MKWKRITKEMASGWYLVTNNLKARDARDQMSHLWLTSFIQESSEPGKYGRFICFTDHDQMIQNLSHFVELELP